MVDTTPPLGETTQDKAVALAKGGIGLIPLAGSVLAEVVGILIPNQRLERLEVYCRFLREQIDRMGVSEERLRETESLDLFEDGARQAVRALTDERKSRIAKVVAAGIAGDERRRLDAKRMLGLIEEIDEDQIIMLMGHLHRHRRDAGFRDRHRSVLNAPPIHMRSSQEDRDQAAIHGAAEGQLVRLGLLRTKFKVPKKGEAAEYDANSGQLKALGHELTPLGLLLLRHLELATEDEF